MAGLEHGGGDGTRLDAEVSYGLPVGSRFVGTPRAGVRTSSWGSMRTAVRVRCWTAQITACSRRPRCAGSGGAQGAAGRAFGRILHRLGRL